MRVFLVHIRDPQFYAIPAEARGKNGRLQVMGFPPIGIMSLSSVLKRAGHEVWMFDQANPETPNETIVAEMRRIQPQLVGLSFSLVGMVLGSLVPSAAAHPAVHHHGER